MATILVTGGAGFIGSHVCDALVRKRHKVIVLDDFSTGKEENLSVIKDKVTIIKGDIKDRAIVAAAMDEAGAVDYIVHLAAFVSARGSIAKPWETHAINVEGTRIVLDEALRHNVKKVVLASSAAVYGAAEPPLKEDAVCKPLSPYGESKLQNEKDALEYHSKGLNCVCMRFFNVYGPRQRPESEYAGVITRFINALAAGEQPMVYGDGSQTRDFIYVEDVVKAIVSALESSKADGQVINVGTGEAVSISDLASTIAKILEKDCAPKYETKKAGDIAHSCADISKMRELLGFKPEFSLKNGLIRTIGEK